MSETEQEGDEIVILTRGDVRKWQIRLEELEKKHAELTRRRQLIKRALDGAMAMKELVEIDIEVATTKLSIPEREG